MRRPFDYPLFAGPVARGAMISVVVRVGGIGIVTVQAILTARLLGPEGYGTVAFVLSLSSIFASIVLLGTEPLATREVARLLTLDDRPALKGFLGMIRRSVVVAGLAGALIWMGIATLVLPGRTEGNWAQYAVFAALIFPVLALTLQMQAVLRGHGLVAMSQLPQMVLRPLVLVAVLCLAYVTAWQIGPLTYLVVAVIANLIAFGVAAYVLRSTLASLREVAATPPRLGALVGAAAPFLAIGAIGVMLGEINTLMLMWWADAEQTGLFQPIARIAPLLMLAMQAVGTRYAPRITEFWTAGETARLADVTRKVTVITTGFTLLSAVVLLFFAKPLLGLFGREFAVNAHALWWIAGAQIVNAACGPAAMLLTMSGHAPRAIGPQLLGLAVNILLGALLIPGRGAEGAAIAMAGGIVTWNLAMLVLVVRRVGFDPSLFGSVIAWRREQLTREAAKVGND